MKHFLLVAILALISSTLFFCTDSNNNPVDPKRPGIQIVSQNGIKKDTITGYSNLDIDIMITVLFADELDSVSYHTGNGLSGSLSLSELSEKHSIKINFATPCTTALMVTGLKNSLEVTSDTAVLFVSDPLTVNINPFRLYASPSLPCTLRVSVNNFYPWQQITLVPQITADSLFIWTPGENDIGKMIPITLIAIDKEMSSVIAKGSVYITVITDNDQLPPPANLKVIEKSNKLVKISWDRESLADSYILYRNDPDMDSAWKSIAVYDTSYIDLTEKALMYRVSSVNYFGVSVPSEMIYVTDTVHYAHRISFADSFSTVSEATASHFIKLQVARPAVDEITVWVSLSGDSDITTDFGASVYLARIAPGDTMGLCTLSIIDDNLSEPNKYYSVSIDSVSHGYISGQKVHNILLADDDSLLSVVYDANGAEAGNVPVDLRHYVKNDVAVIMGNTENLVRKDFFFIGWKKNKADTIGKLYKPGDTLIFDTTCIRLHAQWQISKYSVIYDGNGNTEGSSSVIEEYGDKESITIAAKPDDLGKTGFTFKGWNTEENGTGDTLMPGDSLNTATVKTTLYALWEINKYLVKYDGNGNDFGSVPDSSDYDYGAEIVIRDNFFNLKKKDYLFNGWNTAQDGSGISLAPGDIFSIGSSDITLYAQWKIAPPVITTHPKDTSLRAGNRFLLTVKVSGIGLSYQWQKNETNITGATSDSLVIDTITGSNSASYRCIVSNTEGSVISNSSFLNVISVASVSTGENHTLILMTDGTAWGTGSNKSGQLNIGTKQETSIPVYIMSEVSMVAAGTSISYFVTKSGDLIKICNNQSNKISSEVASVHAIPFSEYVMVLKNNAVLWIYFPSDSIKLADSVSSFHGSLNHLLFIKGGNLYARGSNLNGEFGNGTTADAEEFIMIETGVSSAVAGPYHTLMLKNGFLYATGDNCSGQHGNGTYQNTILFTEITGNVSSISTFYYHSMIIKDDGKLYGAGFNETGQLGADTTLENIPMFVPVMEDVEFVSAGNNHTMIIKKDGTLWATGYNGYGQLGIKTVNFVYKPELVKF